MPGVDLELNNPPAVARAIDGRMNLRVTETSVVVRAAKPPGDDIDGRPVERGSDSQRELTFRCEIERILPNHTNPVY
jgi:hypothetical protein